MFLVTDLSEANVPLIAVGQDRDDLVIPVEVLRSLFSALSGRRSVHLTEFGMFRHSNPTTRGLSPVGFAWDLDKFYCHPLSRTAY